MNQSMSRSSVSVRTMSSLLRVVVKQASTYCVLLYHPLHLSNCEFKNLFCDASHPGCCAGRRCATTIHPTNTTNTSANTPGIASTTTAATTTALSTTTTTSPATNAATFSSAAAATGHAATPPAAPGAPAACRAACAARCSAAAGVQRVRRRPAVRCVPDTPVVGRLPSPDATTEARDMLRVYHVGRKLQGRGRVRRRDGRGRLHEGC